MEKLTISQLRTKLNSLIFLALHLGPSKRLQKLIDTVSSEIEKRAGIHGIDT
jgi:hypothetical protein